MKKTMASELTLVTGMGRVPMTRSQIASWRRRVNGSPSRDGRPSSR